jgi:hypothetical protein
MQNSAAFASFKQKLIDEIGAGYSGFTCFGDAFDRYNEVNDRYNSEAIAFYAGAMKFWLCATEKENCNADNQFKCGFTNGLLQELDWLTLVDAVSEFEITKEDIKEVLLCLANDIPIGTHPSNPTFEDAVFKCITGISLTGLKDGINEFVKENWTEPYYQGQATVFALTLISPFKAGIVKKLNKLTKYSSKITKFESLAKATNADELIAASKKLAKGSGKTFDVSKLQQWIKNISTRNPAGAAGSAPRVYQERVAGLLEYEIKGADNVKIWADGVDQATGKVIEAKYISNPGASPFVEGSSCYPPVRQKIVEQVTDEFDRYSKIIKDPQTPLIELEVTISDAQAKPFFEKLLKDFDIPGQVVVKP